LESWSSTPLSKMTLARESPIRKAVPARGSMMDSPRANDPEMCLMCLGFVMNLMGNLQFPLKCMVGGVGRLLSGGVHSWDSSNSAEILPLTRPAELLRDLHDKTQFLQHIITRTKPLPRYQGMETRPSIFAPRGITPDFYNRKREVRAQRCTSVVMVLLFILMAICFQIFGKECEGSYIQYRSTHCRGPMENALGAYGNCMAAAREAVPIFLCLG
jgi:hypothetical protein